MKQIKTNPQRADFHVHTTFCDGNNSAEEMVLSAIEKGFSVLGFSAHAPMPFSVDWCMKKENALVYRREIKRLKEKYKDKITILCGVEQDYYSEESTDGYDFVIGSVHYVKKNGEYLPIDHAKSLLIEGAERLYGGDILAFAEDYYATIGAVVEKVNPDIIGHFDVFSKFNEKNDLFDPENARYRRAWQGAVNSILEKNKDVLFEINTGAISRGYRREPYPSREIMTYLASQNAHAVLTSDSHRTDSIGYFFADAAEAAYSCGLSLAHSLRGVAWRREDGE